jgi:hypothetical protein
MFVEINFRNKKWDRFYWSLVELDGSLKEGDGNGEGNFRQTFSLYFTIKVFRIFSVP